MALVQHTVHWCRRCSEPRMNRMEQLHCLLASSAAIRAGDSPPVSTSVEPLLCATRRICAGSGCGLTQHTHCVRFCCEQPVGLSLVHLNIYETWDL